MKKENHQTETVRIDPVRAHAMHAMLGCLGDPPNPGDPLPHFWHWGQFWTIIPGAGLGRDGHPKLGGFIPDMGMPRRMWAGGALEFERPLIVGETAVRESTVTNNAKKAGRSGPLAFVTVEHRISSCDQLCVKERQDLVYREDPDPDAPLPPVTQARDDETVSRSHAVSTTDLFRYSALTFNGHRIHYDLDYAREVEGYPGLITHGPLLAQRMIELAQDTLGSVSRFSFRAVSPLFHFEGFEVCANESGDGLELWVRGPDGRLAMTGKAS